MAGVLCFPVIKTIKFYVVYLRSLFSAPLLLACFWSCIILLSFSSWFPLLGPVLVRVTIAVMKHNEQVNVGRAWFILFILPHHCSLRMEIRTGTQPGRNREAGVDAAAMEGCRLLACTACSVTELKTTSSGMEDASCNGLGPLP